MTAIPSIVHTVHEGRGVLPLGGRLLGGSRGGCGAAHGGDGQHDAGEHGGEPDHADDDSPDVAHDHAGDQTADAREHEESPVNEVPIAQCAIARRRAHDVGVIVEEMAFHLVEQTLLLFGEWHFVPSGIVRSILRAPDARRLAVRPLIALRMLGVVSSPPRSSKPSPPAWSSSSRGCALSRPSTAPMPSLSSTLRPTRSWAESGCAPGSAMRDGRRSRVRPIVRRPKAKPSGTRARRSRSSSRQRSCTTTSSTTPTRVGADRPRIAP